MMDRFTIFHFYLIFFLLGLGYAIIAVVMGQIMGGHEASGDAEAGGDWDAGADAGVEVAGDVDVSGDFDAAGDVEAAGDMDAGGDVDAGADAEAAGEGGVAEAGMAEAMPEISALSPVTIATFATSFGGSGVILDKVGLPAFASVPFAAGSGFAIAVGVFYLFHKIFSVTQSTSTVSERSAIGRQAEVITPIPEGGIGEIAYVLGGRRFNAAARTEDGHVISSGASVVTLRKVGGTFYVRESAVERLESP